MLLSLRSLATAMIFVLPFIIISAQAPSLGSAQEFAVFTAAGAFSNDGATVVTGDIGTNVGSFTGFPPGVVIGEIHVANMTSAQAATDVDLAYAELATQMCDSVLGVNLGNNQTLTPNTYCTGAATTLDGILIFDAQGDPDAIFIIKIDGAFSTSTNSSVVLLNGASLCNIYWQINGAVSLGVNSDFLGNILANGAISLLEGASLMGRALSRAGAIDMHNNVVSIGLPAIAPVIVAEGPTTFCPGGSVVISGNIDGVFSNGSTGASITVTTSGDYYVVNTTLCGTDTSNHIIVIVSDVTPPEIVCPIDLTLQCDEDVSPQGAAGMATSTDNCDVSPEITFTDISVASPACAQNSTITRTWTSTDDSGNTVSCTQSISVEDTNPPIITCAEVISPVECNTTPVFPPPTVSDGCDGSVDITFVNDSIGGSCAQNYTLTRTWTAIDACGNSASCTQSISFNDTTAPGISCPPDLTLQGNADTTPGATGTASAIDNCDPIPVVGFTDITIVGTCPQDFVITRTWTATDACGNANTCVQTITVQGSGILSIDCPANITIECDESTLPGNTGTATSTSECGQAAVISYTDVFVEGQCSNEGNIIRTWVATDAAGNTVSCEQSISIEDNVAPSIICPPDLTLQPNADTTPAATGTASSNDNCDPAPGVTFSDITVAGSCPGDFTITRTWTSTDDCGNFNSCDQIIVIQSSGSLSITCPVDITIACDESSLPSNTGMATGSAGCGSGVVISFIDLFTQGTCSQEGIIIRTWIATDDAGNTVSCSQSITIQDILPPVIVCATVISPIACGSTPVFPVPTATDACGGNVLVTFLDQNIPGNCPQNFSIIRTWTATDECGNTAQCSATIVVQDILPPVIVCATVISPIACGTTPSFPVPTATDACDAQVDVTFMDQNTPGNCPQNYSVTRIWTATDNCGNTAQCSATIVVQDIIPPVIICATVVSPIACGTTPSFPVPTATDACDGQVDVTFIDQNTPGNCPQNFSITRIWTATDNCGNTAQCSATIVVQDIIPPVIICATVVSPIACGLIPSFPVPTATDACDAQVDVTFIDQNTPGNCPQNYSVTRIWTATDNCGNTAQCSAMIVVQDIIPPVIICATVVSPIACGSTPVFPVPTATDACDANVLVTFSDQNIPGNCPQNFSVIRTWTATDDCGNTAQCSATIVVQDILPPVIICATVISPIACGSTPVFPMPTATDACDANVLVTFSDQTIPGNCPQNFSIRRTWTATDDCGNSAQCSATIVVQDILPPVIVCPANATVECLEDIPAFNITSPTASDNCSTVTVTHLGDFTSGQICGNNFSLTRIYSASDACGNSATCQQIFTVLPNTPPIIILPQELIDGDTLMVQCYGQDPEWDLPLFDENSVTFLDNCDGDVTITFDQSFEAEGNCDEDGYINVQMLTWTATDECGTTASASIFLTLIDTIPPVLFGVPNDITIACDEIPAPPTEIFATDECLCACVISFTETGLSLPGCQDGRVVVRSWTAKDRCGNMSTAEQRITLTDNSGPSLAFVVTELNGVLNGDVLTYTCSEEGFPAFIGALNAQAVISTTSCGDLPSVQFTMKTHTANNCEFYGYVEQRTFQWTAVDECGNASTLTLVVELDDDEAPVFSTDLPAFACVGDPALQNIEAADNCSEAAVRYWDVRIDNPCGDGQAIRRTFEAFDPCGNITRDTVILLPNEDVQPLLSFIDSVMIGSILDEPILVSCSFQNGQYTPFGTGDVLFTGGCGEGVTMAFTETVLSTGDCSAQEFVAVVELMWSATDVCGNRTELIRIANIMDDGNPVFGSYASALSVGCADSIPEIQVSDNCGTVSMITVDEIIQGACAYEYTIIRQVTATDPCGNVSTANQSIQVGNGGGPVMSGIEPELCDDLRIPVVTAFDACAEAFVPVTMVQDTLDVPCQDGLVIRRIWTASDLCGHVREIVQTIIMNDHTAPEIIIPSFSVIRDFDMHDSNFVHLSAEEIIKRLLDLNENSVNVTDGCDLEILPEFTIDTTLLDCHTTGFSNRIIYTWMVRDACDNADSISFSVYTIDNLPPVFILTPLDTVIICDPLLPGVVLTTMDTTDIITYNQNVVPTQVNNEWIIIRTWVATDLCGNSTTHVQRIFWTSESILDCTILLPETIECNSHGVVITSDLTGPYEYLWEVVGEKCFIQSGQNTPEITIYVGWSEVKIILTIMDTFGCVTMCMTTLDCVFPSEIPLVQALVGDQLISNSTPVNQHETVTQNEGYGKNHMNVWPNPADRDLHIQFTSRTEQDVRFTLLNLLGQNLHEVSFHAARGENQIPLDLQLVPEGTYFIQAHTANEQLLQKVVILH